MPVISIRASDEWLAMVDAEAEKHLWSRNAAIVNILWQVLGDKRDMQSPSVGVGESREKTPTIKPHLIPGNHGLSHSENCHCYICRPPK